MIFKMVVFPQPDGPKIDTSKLKEVLSKIYPSSEPGNLQFPFLQRHYSEFRPGH